MKGQPAPRRPSPALGPYSCFRIIGGSRVRLHRCGDHIEEAEAGLTSGVIWAIENNEPCNAILLGSFKTVKLLIFLQIVSGQFSFREHFRACNEPQILSRWFQILSDPLIMISNELQISGCELILSDLHLWRWIDLIWFAPKYLGLDVGAGVIRNSKIGCERRT